MFFKLKYFIQRKSQGSTAILIAVIILAVIALFIIIIGLSLMTGLTGNNSGGGGTAGYSNLTYPSGIDQTAAGECLDSYMKSVVPSSPLIGYGTVFVQAGQQYNVNPALMVAIGKQESVLGTKGVVLSNKYNYYGLTKAGGGWAEFSSWDEAINNQARYLRESYLNQGLGTIEQISAKYAPIGATNDPNNLNKNWVKGVSDNFSAVISKCPSLSVIPTFAGSGDIVAVAQAELGTTEPYDNCDCGPVLKYGGRPSNPWCAFFVSWVYRKAGYNMPSIGRAKTLYEWFGKNQISFTKGSATPQPGDIVYFNHSHVGIVESVGDDGVLHTIEGNAGQHPQSVKRETYRNYLNNSDIAGFGRWKK